MMKYVGPVQSEEELLESLAAMPTARKRQFFLHYLHMNSGPKGRKAVVRWLLEQKDLEPLELGVTDEDLGLNG